MNRAFTWVFDLDNTLHDAGRCIFPRINRRMTEYVMRELGLPEAEADALRTAYWRRYGATLAGLVRHHGIRADHFLRHAHDLGPLHALTRPPPRLRATLLALPGRKLVFSNGARHYVHGILRVLGVDDLFAGVFSIEDSGYLGKQRRKGFRRLFRRYRLDPRRTILVEDDPNNLRVARSLGMKTVWVSASLRRPPQVDAVIREIGDLSALARRWARAA